MSCYTPTIAATDQKTNRNPTACPLNISHKRLENKEKWSERTILPRPHIAIFCGGFHADKRKYLRQNWLRSFLRKWWKRGGAVFNQALVIQRVACAWKSCAEADSTPNPV
jgi:hypothetical protein